MDLVAISSNAAAVAGTISGVRYSYATEQSAIPGTPAVVVGLARNATVIGGDRQVTNFELPVRLYVEAVSERPRNVATIYGYVSTFVTTYALNQNLGGTVQQAYVSNWNTDLRYEVAGALYEAVDFTLAITVHEQVNQHL